MTFLLIKKQGAISYLRINFLILVKAYFSILIKTVSHACSSIKPLLSLFLLIGLSSCYSFKKTSDSKLTTPGLTRITVMSYNVENLFDTTHDSGKNDFAFLPLKKKQTAAHKSFCAPIAVPKWKDECLNKNWDKPHLNEKLNRLTDVINQVEDGAGPDILLLQEVENIDVLKQWNSKYLDSRYKNVVLIEGQDIRGIDVGLLTKLKVMGTPRLHQIPFEFDDPKRAQDTRGILQVDLELPDQSLLTVFVLHLPNPLHPHVLRTQALNHLNHLASLIPKENYIIAGGDFNITPEEASQQKRSQFLSKNWVVTHPDLCLSCPGTYFFAPKQSWSYLDWLLVSKNFEEQRSAWHLDKKSIKLINQSQFQKTTEGYPASFNSLNNTEGVSDHFPIYLEIYRPLKL